MRLREHSVHSVEIWSGGKVPTLPHCGVVICKFFPPRFLQNFRQINFFTKELYCKSISRKSFVVGEPKLPHCGERISCCSFHHSLEIMAFACVFYNHTLWKFRNFTLQYWCFLTKSSVNLPISLKLHVKCFHEIFFKWNTLRKLWNFLQYSIINRFSQKKFREINFYIKVLSHFDFTKFFPSKRKMCFSKTLKEKFCTIYKLYTTVHLTRFHEISYCHQNTSALLRWFHEKFAIKVSHWQTVNVAIFHTVSRWQFQTYLPMDRTWVIPRVSITDGFRACSKVPK